MRLACKSIWAAAICCAVLARVPEAKGWVDAPSVKTYKQNFVLTSADSKDHPDGRDRDELKFQISLKYQPVDDFNLYFGYTQKSFWQMYDSSKSSPFRENNFNPEIFYDWNIGGSGEMLWALQFGFEHESNGRGPEFDESLGMNVNKSRSWNRLYLHPKVMFGPSFLVALKLWQRLDEDPKVDPSAAEGDDNEDIEKFLGHGELRVILKPVAGLDFQVLAMFRDGSSPAHDTYQVDFIFRPGWLTDGMYFQLHYFNGFGESLIDFDRRVNKMGIGFAAGNPFASMFPQ